MKDRERGCPGDLLCSLPQEVPSVSRSLDFRRRAPGRCATIEHMFDSSRVEGLPVAGIPVDEDCFDPAWLDEAAWRSAAAGPREPALPPVSACAPPGWLALELDQGCADPMRWPWRCGCRG